MEESIRKIIRKILNEEVELPDERKQHEKDYDAGYLTSKWMYEKDYESQKKMFIHDSYEKLTGFFGLIDHENISKAFKIIGKIFDESMRKKYDHGIETAVMKNGHEYKIQIHTLAKFLKTSDLEKIHGLIDNVFNGE